MIDRYTKTVLTIIAAALVTIAVQNEIGPARAQETISLGYTMPAELQLTRFVRFTTSSGASAV